MDRTEKRYDSAKNKLIKGFIALLGQKDFLDIGVKELCLISEVNRSTFYAHYQNTFELLEDCRSYMIQVFMDSYSDEQRERFIRGEYKSEYIKSEFLIPYLKQIRKNRAIYQTYMKLKLSFFDEEEVLNSLVENVALPTSRKRGSQVDRLALTYATKYTIEGVNAVVSYWIKRDFKESEEWICEIITRMIKKPDSHK